MPRREMIVRSLAARAVRGNVAAADKILALEVAAFGFEEVRAADQGLSDNDRLILEQFLGGGASAVLVLPQLEAPLTDTPAPDDVAGFPDIPDE